MTDQNSILKGCSPQSEPHEKEPEKHDLTRPGSHRKPLACEANDDPLSHSGEGLGSQKYWMYMWLKSKMKAGIIENNSCNQETTGKKLRTSHVFQCCPY